MLRLIKQSRCMGIEAHIHAPLFLKANDILFTHTHTHTHTHIYIYIYIRLLQGVSATTSFDDGGGY